MKRRIIAFAGPLVLLHTLLIAACADTPPPRLVYQDHITAIRIQVDDRTSEAHSHPANVTPVEMAAVLDGVRTLSRRGGVFGSIATGAPEATTAFLPSEIETLAPQISRALGEAKPNELVTFYRRYSDAGTGLAVTSGAVFVDEKQLYFVLANSRDTPAEALNFYQPYDIDPIDNPLLPISRSSFRAVFYPIALMIPEDERRPWPYIDEGRVLAIDLWVLRKQMKNASAMPAKQ